MTLLVCGDHGTPSPHQDRAESEVVFIPNLCGDSSALAEAGVTDPEALILHIDEFDLGFMQVAIRRMGADPLGIPIVKLVGIPTVEQIDILAAGVIARHRAFPGTGPEHAKMQWPELMSRRRLFALNVPQYIGVPSIDSTLCAAERGCRLCVDACPTSALQWDSGSIAYTVDPCIACGICVTTCPTGATVNPVATERQIAAQVGAMVAASKGPIGIEFRCRDARTQPLTDGWFPIEVPCTGMLTIGWLLAPIVLGAGAVAAPTCSESGGAIGNDDVLTARRADARLILEELGFAGDRVRDQGRNPMSEIGEGDTSRVLRSFGDADVYLALSELAHVTDAVFPSTSGFIGVVTIDGSACTICEQCTKVCPSGALTSERSDGAVEISFDPFSCVGCAMCAATCPEIEGGAIALERRFDVTELKLGHRVLHSGSMSTCEVCGGPNAPSAMLERIQSMLGPEHAGTSDLISRRCLNCR